MSLPDDLLQAYTTFTFLAMKHGYSYAGMMVGKEPPSITCIGNVTERGHDFAKLLRMYADVVDERTDAGMFQEESANPSKVN
jgi:hypothetical protein